MEQESFMNSQNDLGLQPIAVNQTLSNLIGKLYMAYDGKCLFLLPLKIAAVF